MPPVLNKIFPRPRTREQLLLSTLAADKNGFMPALPSSLIYLIPIVALALALSSCGADSTTRQPVSIPADMAFQIDTFLLGPAYRDSTLRVAVRPPRDWRYIDQANPAPLGQALRERLDSLGFERHALFFDTSAQAFLVLLPATETTAGKAAGLAPAANWKTLSRDSFTYHGFQVEQSVQRSDELIHFRLAFQRDSLPDFRLEYFVPHAAYTESTGRRIESSLGSVNSF